MRAVTVKNQHPCCIVLSVELAAHGRSTLSLADDDNPFVVCALFHMRLPTQHNAAAKPKQLDLHQACTPNAIDASVTATPLHAMPASSLMLLHAVYIIGEKSNLLDQQSA